MAIRKNKNNNDNRARRLRDALRRTIVAHGALEDARRPCGAPLALPEAYALLELLQSDTPMTVSQLAEKLSIDRTNVSRLCARMEESGELVKEPSAEDARVRVVRLTARGTKLARSVDDSSAAHFDGLAKSLGASAGRVIEALELLEEAMTSEDDE